LSDAVVALPAHLFKRVAEYWYEISVILICLGIGKSYGISSAFKLSFTKEFIKQNTEKSLKTKERNLLKTLNTLIHETLSEKNAYVHYS
jgi:hypothetical protein